MRYNATALAALSASLALVSPAARAIPAFARKSGLSCSACHEAWPRLNEFGQQFRDNGYRLRHGRDAPPEQSSAYWPIAFRTTVGYQLLRQTQQPTDAGPATTETGTFGFSGLDIHSAGTLADKVSYFITYTPALRSAGFTLAPSDGDLESAWAGLHELFGTTWLNLRVGKFALDLPEDEHRALTLTQGYNVYHFHPDGSAVTFEPGNNQVGLEVFGHDDLSRLRYSVSLVNANDAPLSKNVISTPVVWGHLTGTRHFDNDVLPAVKIGLFGGLGWQPTTAQLLTVDGAPAPVVGSASSLAQFRRVGAEAHLYLLSNIYPLTLTGVVTYGSDDQALIANGTSDASFVGGWAEITYTPTVYLVLQARYERVRNRIQGVGGNPADLGNLSVYTGTLRYTLELSNRTEVAAHAEVSSSRRVVDGTGNNPNTLTGLMAIDFVF
jgi:hypothetical protein